MPALFKIRFAGGDVHPDTVPAHELAELLIATEQALTSVVAQENPDVDTSELIVGLVNVKDESLGLEFATSRPALFERAFDRVTVAVSSRRFDELPSRAIVGIQTIASFNHRRRCQAQIWDARRQSTAPVAVMDEDFASSIPERPKLRGETVLFGLVERVGGVEPKVRLRISDKESISCHISEELAKRVGNRLYDEVGLRGQATWDGADFELLYFHAEELLSYRAGSLTQAFRALTEAVGGAYDSIGDVDEFVRHLRHGEAS